jgi:uncharacterized protein YlbG (UPF0298 family)
MKAMYIFEFDVCEKRRFTFTRKGKTSGFKVRNEHIKIGETENFKERWESYKKDYFCNFCNCGKLQVKKYKVWEVNFGKQIRTSIEEEIKREFPHLHKGGKLDYFQINGKSDKEKIKNKMQELIDQKNSNKFKD